MASIPLVCVVDDQADFRFLLQQIFQRYCPAYPVRFFDSGYALLDELPQLSPKPSLILLDRHMPVLDGHQTLLALKGHSAHKKIPVIMMSAEASAFEINDCYEAGVNSFLMKKLDLHAMKAMIEAVCHYWLEISQQPIEG
ncbi:response regulator [Spirosoma pulveris]